jgi:hypothetical protein
MAEREKRPDLVSRRAILASLPISALAGGLAGGGISAALYGARSNGFGSAPPGVGSTAIPGGSNRPRFDATEHGVLGDGTTDNAAALNLLISSVPAGHDIILPAGEYRIGDRLRLRSGVNLVGAGSSVTTIRLADGADTTFLLMSGESGVRLAGITFDGGSQSIDEVALQIDSCTDIVVEECAFVRMSHAVHIYATGLSTSSRVTVRENHFSSIIDFAVRVGEGASSILIENNSVADVTKAKAPSPAAFYVRGRDISVVGNVVDSSEDSGVLVAGADTSNVSVVGNTFRTTLVGIYYGTGATEGTITGNTVESDRDFGIHLFDREGSSSKTVVAQNHVVSSGKSGIQVEGVTDLIISSNLIIDPGTRDDQKASWRCGIAFTATDGGPASEYIVVGNVIASDSPSSRMEHAVLIAVGSKNVRIGANVLRGALGSAVEMERDLIPPYYVETDEDIITSFALRKQ